MPTLKDKIRGVFLGIGIGDALGMPVETFPAAKIAEKYGRITEYREPKDHKWFNGQPAGMTTDDTQLTLAVAKGLIAAGLDMDEQGRQHVAAFKQTDAGWGYSTREAVRSIANNVSWRESGVAFVKGKGAGNGVPMKIAPVGILLHKAIDINPSIAEVGKIVGFVWDLNAMTHRASVSASAAFAHALAVRTCLEMNNRDVREHNYFNQNKFLDMVCQGAEAGKEQFPDTVTDDISKRFRELYDVQKSERWSDAAIIEKYNGSCYCYHSLPFSYAFFLRNPTSIECMYDVASAGGDTDSNASIVGALLGALNGAGIFPQHLLDGLRGRDEIEAVAEAFSAKYV